MIQYKMVSREAHWPEHGQVELKHGQMELKHGQRKLKRKQVEPKRWQMNHDDGKLSPKTEGKLSHKTKVNWADGDWRVTAFSVIYNGLTGIGGLQCSL